MSQLDLVWNEPVEASWGVAEGAVGWCSCGFRVACCYLPSKRDRAERVRVLLRAHDCPLGGPG